MKEDGSMKLKPLFLFGLMVSLLTTASVSFAQKPTNPDDPTQYLGNGFPSGPHYNLLIHGKGATFRCPQPEFYLRVTVDNNGDSDAGLLVTECDEGDVCEATDIQIFGNVINCPRVQGTDPITILMESGLKGPKSAPATIGLEVTDWCTESFPDDGSIAPPLGDSAVMRLQKNDLGYAVFARVVGRPGENGGPTFNMIPSLQLVQDEAGNDLVLLGFVTPTGVFNEDGIPINRYDTTKSGKGVKGATNISNLFKWTGDVCYVQADTDPYCIVEGENVCTSLALCCVDTSDPLDGLWDRCDLLTDVGVDLDFDGDYECPVNDGTYPYWPVAGTCRQYENQWVFNIADFVNVLWDVTHDGVYNVQIRFYPLPLNQVQAEP
jgi:hypothetical protein